MQNINIYINAIISDLESNLSDIYIFILAWSEQISEEKKTNPRTFCQLIKT